MIYNIKLREFETLNTYMQIKLTLGFIHLYNFLTNAQILFSQE